MCFLYIIRYVEPLVYGDYPKIMRELVKERLPEFSEEEKSLLNGSVDFIGMNYYVSSYAQSMKEPPSGILHHAVDSLANELGKISDMLFFLE